FALSIQKISVLSKIFSKYNCCLRMNSQRRKKRLKISALVGAPSLRRDASQNPSTCKSPKERGRQALNTGNHCSSTIPKPCSTTYLKIRS
ncbi:putative transcription-repair coupling factor, partial [Vibrio parahaemolyticus EKP-028]